METQRLRELPCDSWLRSKFGIPIQVCLILFLSQKLSPQNLVLANSPNFRVLLWTVSNCQPLRLNVGWGRQCWCRSVGFSKDTWGHPLP